MTERDLPRGARANAVPPPAAWARLEEIDARVVQPLLETLEDTGIAAYVEPFGPGVSLLHVDAERADLAHAIVAAELPGLVAELGPVADGFDAIVAGWDDPVDVAVAPWPVQEDVPAHPVHRAEAEPDRPVAAPRPVDDDHFVPPPPPELPAPHPVTRRAVLAVSLGLFVLVVLPLFDTQPSLFISVLGAISIIAGLGTLVWRMRDAPSVDDGPDDGAVL